MTLLERATAALERASVLDGAAKALDRAVRPLLTGRRARTLLSGTPLGHPAHPALIAVPLGSWLATSSFDAFGDDTTRQAARHLALLGCVSAVPAAVTGLSDWLDTEGAERRVGLVHASLNLGALTLYAASAVARRRGSLRAGAGLAGIGALSVGAAGWLGGHLTYARGVGVDTTAFQILPEEWTDLVADSAVPAGRAVKAGVDGVAIVLVRVGGEMHALDDRCTHRGGPLHEGELTATTISCPWHDSEFDLEDGRVRCGPATRPQRVLDVRVIDGMVQVRRHTEHGTLRANPVTG